LANTRHRDSRSRRPHRTPAPLDLTHLRGGLPGLTAAHCTALCECAAVCLEAARHPSQVELQLEGHFRTRHPLRWTSTTGQTLRSWADLQEATEKGACGLAIAIILHKTPYTVIERSIRGTGFDYWLGEASATDCDIFANKARLEVSGLLFGNRGDVDLRCRKKARQMQATNRSLPGYAIVVEFSAPRAKVMRR